MTTSAAVDTRTIAVPDLFLATRHLVNAELVLRDQGHHKEADAIELYAGKIHAILEEIEPQ